VVGRCRHHRPVAGIDGGEQGDGVGACDAWLATTTQPPGGSSPDVPIPPVTVSADRQNACRSRAGMSAPVPGRWVAAGRVAAASIVMLHRP